MTNLPSWRTYNVSWVQFKDPSVDALYITKPDYPQDVLKYFPILKAVFFDFGKSGFKKNFDYHEYLDIWFKNSRLEILGISGGHNLKSLPKSLASQPLKDLRINLGDKIDLEETLHLVPQLGALRVVTDKSIQLGTNFSRFTELEDLNIRADQVQDLDRIWEHTSLQNLHLDIKNLEVLPKGIYDLNSLRSLSIKGGNLKVIKPGEGLKSLHALDLSLPLATPNIPRGIFSSSIVKLYFWGSNSSKEGGLPARIDLPNLEELRFTQNTTASFPELIVPKLKTASINSKNSHILSRLKQTQDLTELSVSSPCSEDPSNLVAPSLKTYRGPFLHTNNVMDTSCWPVLSVLSINGASDQASSLIFNQELNDLSINGNFLQDNLDNLPPNIERIKLSNISGLKTLSLQNLPDLKSVAISACPDFEHLLAKPGSLPALGYVEIVKCSKFERLHDNMFLCPSLYNLHTNNNKREILKGTLKNRAKIFKYLKANKLKEEELLTLGYWLLGNNHFKQVDRSIKESTLSLFSYSNNEIFRHLTSIIVELNPDGVSFADLDIGDIRNKEVAIVGSTFGTKKSLKEAAAKIGLQLTKKAEEAEFIILGKKAKVDFSPDSHIIFLAENELNEYSERINPAYLKSQETSEKVKDNLRQVLWSTDPKTENMALEMMKKGGMPNKVIGECIAIAKTSTDKNVKSKYKRFLKGRINPEQFSLVSKNVNFSTSRPFWKLRSEFSLDLLGRLALALYKRAGNYWSEALMYHHDDYELRKEIVDNELIPQVLLKPHYIQLGYNLTSDELHSILSIPEVTGKLKRLILSTCDSNLPDIIGDHITLKELRVSGSKIEAFPDLIYKLKRLSILSLTCKDLNIGAEIVNLKQLKEIFIYKETPLEIHHSIKELPKIDRIYSPKGVEYIQ